MKTLLERLKPEYLELLENEKTNFPFLVDAVKYELKYVHFFTEIRVGFACSLCDLCKISLGLVELDSLFIKE